jgi:hypothetical protein
MSSNLDGQTATFEDVIVKRETDKAILVLIPEIDDENHWIPKSAIDDDSEVYQMGTSGALIIQRWLALANEWVDE